jgi:HD-GYP domain-containing protein (c-di-GMP phosphodiesterase class II)
MLDEFMQMMYATDPDLSGHGSRVAYLSAPLADYLGLDRDDRRRLHIAAHLHDVGKIRVDTRVVQKPGPLTAREWTEMRKHPLAGFRIVDGLVHARIADTVIAHHERFDGSGYPFGLRGNDIPYLARILLVADAYDAMTSDRPYQQALSPGYAMAELQHCAGTQFDPGVVDAMLAVVSSSDQHTMALAG